ncbi:MAG: SGNH/GDSL hydrolase family protein [Akkermansiaceae bacterium]|nr:SGNH/GDSL hydrolase family protein [Akkermansiaceae bacterium]
MKILAAILVLTLSLRADPLTGARRIVFLGDSITHGGHYIVLLEAALRGTHPQASFINLGLPSEGVTGLSEPAHPFPRPNVHERLARVLARAKPDVVFACYGMNDGIYHPFSQERFDQYKDGIDALIEAVRESGAKLILLTPPPFDPHPMKAGGKLRPAGAPEYSWKEIYEHYDRDVIAPYAKWLLAQGERVTAVIDLHGPITAHVNERRRSDPEFVLSGDGVHLDPAGHRLMADAIHRAIYDRPLPAIPPAELEVRSRQHALMHAAWLTHTGHQRPGMKAGLPLEEARAKAARLRESQP